MVVGLTVAVVLLVLGIIVLGGLLLLSLQDNDKTLESVAELTKQRVSDRQIAMIHGLYEDNGDLSLRKVTEERVTPGKWLNSKQALTDRRRLKYLKDENDGLRKSLAAVQERVFAIDEILRSSGPGRGRKFYVQQMKLIRLLRKEIDISEDD